MSLNRLTVFFAFLFSTSQLLNAANYIHNFQFNEANGTKLNNLTNDGSLGPATFNFSGPRVQAGLLNIGTTPNGYVWPTGDALVNSNTTRKIETPNAAISDSGIYKFTVRINDWNLTNAGKNNGLRFSIGYKDADSESLTFGEDKLAHLEFEHNNSGTNIRVQVSHTGLYSATNIKEVGLNSIGINSPSSGEGVIMQLTVDLYTGFWTTRAKAEGGSWYPLITDGKGFTDLDRVQLVINGANANTVQDDDGNFGTGWTAENYVRVDYLTVEKVEEDYIQYWGFDQASGSTLSDTVNIGSDSDAEWDSDGPRHQGGNLNIGDTPSWKWNSPGGSQYIDTKITNAALFSTPLTSGSYRMEFRVDDWDFDGIDADGSGTTNNGIKVQLGTVSNMVSIEFETNANGNDVRVRNQNSNNSTGTLRGTDAEYGVGSQGLVGSKGVIVQLYANLFTGEWSTRAKIDDDDEVWRDIVTDGEGLYSFDRINLVSDGTNGDGWQAGQFVQLDYISILPVEEKYEQLWQFNDVNKELSNVINSGFDDIGFNTGSADFFTNDSGKLVFESIGNPSNAGGYTVYRNSDVFNKPLESGKYIVEFMVSDWDMDLQSGDNSGRTNDGIKVAAGSDDLNTGYVQLEFEVAQAAASDRMRVRSVGSNTGDLSGTDAQTTSGMYIDRATTGSPVVVQLYVDLDSGAWFTRAKVDDSEGEWIDLVTDGQGFTKLDKIKIVTEATSGGWLTHQYIHLDYVAVRDVSSYVQNWQFDDASGTALTAVLNTGSDSASWNNDGPRTNNGKLNLGDTSAYKWNDPVGAGATYTDSQIFKKAMFNSPLNSGTYRMEFRVADWDFDGLNDGSGVTNNGIQVQFGTSDQTVGGLMSIELESASLSGDTGIVDDVRIHSVNSSNGNLAGSNGENRLGDQGDLDTGPPLIVQVTANLDTGNWSSRAKLVDDENTWRDLVTDGTNFNQIDQVKFAINGSANEWEQGEFVTIDYLTVERLSVAPSNLFANWISNYSVNSNVNFYDDPDGDGKENGLEHAFSTDPSVSDTSGISQLAMVGNSGSFTHPLNPVLSEDVSITYEWSTDLQSFHASGDTVGDTTVVLTPSENLQVLLTTVTANITGTVPANLFVRVSVSQSE